MQRNICGIALTEVFQNISQISTMECRPINKKTKEKGTYHRQAIFVFFLLLFCIMILSCAVSSRVFTNITKRIKCNGSLASADFSGAVFTFAHFQQIAQISSLRNFHYISEGIPSLMGFWLL